MRLKLRRGTVVSVDPLTVQIDGAERPAWVDEKLLGPCRVGDEVIVNTEAVDLELGSGGFDVVHVNVSRGLEDPGSPGEHVMKLNYTSLQHPVDPVERRDAEPVAPIPVLVIPLHGHLAPAAWAVAQHTAGLRVGFVQAGGGALPGTLSRDVGRLRELGLLAGHVTVAPSYGGEHEAMSVCGALDAAGPELGWQAAIVGPGPGIIGSETRLGHGGIAALDAAHAASALGFVTYISPRMSGSDPRPRHRGLSHHTQTVLGLLLSSVGVPVPELDLAAWLAEEEGESPLDALHRVCGDRHDIVVQPVDLDGYGDSGLPRTTMGRDLADDPLFFSAPLAAGRALAAATSPGR
jgi:hypothetical protein